MDRIKEEYAGRLQVLRLDVNDPASQPTMIKYRYPGTPYLVFVTADGEVVFRRGGVRTVDAIRKDVEAVIAKTIGSKPADRLS